MIYRYAVYIYIYTHISTHMVSYQYPSTTEYLRTIVSPTLDFNSCNVRSMVKISRSNLDMDLWCGIDQWPQIFAFSIYRVKARSQVFDRTSGFCLGGCFPKTSDLYMEGNRQKTPKTGTEDLEDTIHQWSLWIMETKKMWFGPRFPVLNLKIHCK